MKSLFEFLALFSIGRVFDLVCSIIKGYFVRLYMNLIDHMRSVYFMMVMTVASLLLLISGFLLLHIALFLYLPWDITDKALLIFILGLAYTTVPIFVIGYYRSRGHWLKISGAKSVLDNLSDPK